MRPTASGRPGSLRTGRAGAADPEHAVGAGRRRRPGASRADGRSRARCSSPRIRSPRRVRGPFLEMPGDAGKSPTKGRFLQRVGRISDIRRQRRRLSCAGHLSGSEDQAFRRCGKNLRPARDAERRTPSYPCGVRFFRRSPLGRVRAGIAGCRPSRGGRANRLGQAAACPPAPGPGLAPTRRPGRAFASGSTPPAPGGRAVRTTRAGRGFGGTEGGRVCRTTVGDWAHAGTFPGGLVVVRSSVNIRRAQGI